MSIAAPPRSRHRTARRELSGGPAFAKAPRSPAHREDLLREAAVYDVLRNRCPATAARVPKGASWNPRAAELQMEVVPAGNLAEQVATCGVLEPAVAAAVGRAIGEFHAEGADLGPSAPASDWLTDGLSIAHPTPRRLRQLTAGGIALIKLLQRSRGLEARLRALAPPAGGALVHGDLRWENVLVEPGTEPAVWLVDWEMGGAGEQAWDAGCFAAACVSAWLCSIPAVPGMAPDQLAAEAGLPMDALALGLDAFWTAYRDVAPGTRTDAWAERCTQLAAVRLVYRGFECTQYDVDLDPVPVSHLQVAANMLDDPVRAAHGLLALS